MSKSAARELLQIDPASQVPLFFGFVRDYKCLNYYLLDAMSIIRKQIPDISLWIVGDFDSQKERYLIIIAEHNLQHNIRLVEGYVPDFEVEKYFAASDLIVLPYTSATQSGIVQIAYGFEKPIVVTNVGGLPDVVETGKIGYVVPSHNPDAIAEAVIHFFRDDTHID